MAQLTLIIIISLLASLFVIVGFILALQFILALVRRCEERLGVVCDVVRNKCGDEVVTVIIANLLPQLNLKSISTNKAQIKKKHEHK